MLSPCSTDRVLSIQLPELEFLKTGLIRWYCKQLRQSSILQQERGESHVGHFRILTRENGSLGQSQITHSILHFWILYLIFYQREPVLRRFGGGQ